MMSKEQAEAMAVDALGWMAMREDVLGGFLAATGASADDLRAQTRDPAFLGFVLDHILSQDQYVLDFAADTHADPTTVAAARAILPGGEQTNWT